MTRAVLFDFYGTLVHATSWGRSYEEVLAGHGYDLGERLRNWLEDDGNFDGREHAEHSVSREAYVAWERARLLRMVEACGVGADDAEGLVDELHGAAKAFSLVAFEEVPDVLREVRRRGVTVAVCSNWDWDLDRGIAQAGLEALVDLVVTSARAGARKPHPRIFRHTLDLLAVAPADVLFVGDSWKCDVQGSLAAGIRCAHVCRDTSTDPPPLVDGVARVADLHGVLDLV